MYKTKFAAAVVALLTAVMLTGCVPKDDFVDYEIIEFSDIDGVTARTEQPEYTGDLKRIDVVVTNDSDDYFSCGAPFLLQKMVDSKWKGIGVSGSYTLLGRTVQAHSEETVNLILEDHVKLPLLPGHYRIWVGDGDGTFDGSWFIPAEFDVK